MVVPESELEKKKVRNLVTAPSSLLIWLITCVMAILPGEIGRPERLRDCQHVFTASLMLLRTPNDSGDILVMLDYQMAAIFVFGSVVSVLYIGSSPELRYKK